MRRKWAAHNRWAGTDRPLHLSLQPDLLHRLGVTLRLVRNHLLRFWKERIPDLDLSRSRPYRKNDNPFVEQRNGSLVRAYIGYDRLDTVQQTRLLNPIYDKLWIYHNLFLPVQRTVQKIDLPSSPGASKMKRVYDQARTPLDRLEETGAVPPLRLELLKQLREEIYDLIDQLFALPGARPGITEDVHLTLRLPSTLSKALLSPVTLSLRSPLG